MAIYHLEAKVVSRGAGRSAVAASAYLSCSKILNDYDGVQHDFTRKKGLVWEQIFLPEYAPAEWQDRAILWNAVEENEKTKDSRLAREFVVALPVELGKSEWQKLLTEFIREQFVADGMCADVTIHDTDGHNPHAHILLTVRPLNENGAWQYKTEKEYLCVRDGEEQGFTAAEFKAAQADGWEKQYQYKVGKKKVYMSPSSAEAQRYERISKYPKSTKYGRQNPISERWNSEEQLFIWREKWAEVTNKYLEQYPWIEARIDHRSHAERGLDEQPTIHEGVAARALEQKGIVSDRCEINRQIKTDNALLRELKAAVRKLAQAVKDTIPALAEAMESLREKMIIFRYQLRHIGKGRRRMKEYIWTVKPELERYAGLVQQIKDKTRERKELLAEKKKTPFFQIPKQRELSRRIAELTEELEDLKSEKELLLQTLECADDAGISAVKKDVAVMESALKKLEEQEKKYSAELADALTEYEKLREQAKEVDADELMDTRLALRPDRERSAISRIQAAYGRKYDPLMMHDSKEDIASMLHEKAEARSIRERLRQKQQAQKQQTQQRQKKQKRHEQER
ncbi:MAG: MobQ family relaxase [Fusicatenibacter sp.]